MVEDNFADSRIIEEYLKQNPEIDFNIEIATKFTDAMSKLSSNSYDLLVLDLSLPDAFGLDAFYKISQAHPRLAIIIVSANRDEALSNKAIQEGAHDFLIKGHFDAKYLFKSFKYAIKRHRANKFNPPKPLVTPMLSTGTKSVEIAASPSPKNLIESYEAILTEVIKNHFNKSPVILRHFKELCTQMLDANYLPEKILDLSKQQKLIKSDHQILMDLNMDLISTMIALFYERKHSYVLKGF
ncbi:MAG: response regulator [Candidatus Caenarcaniphilales bacterium]|nr:response regulator [Candidatus Caenarcaniphilales bacterium]